MPTALISGFAPGDTIDLANVNYISGGVGVTGGIAVLSPTQNVLNVTEGGKSYALSLDPNQSFSGETFSLSPDENGGTDVRVANDPSLLDYFEFADLAYALTPSGLLSTNNPAVSGIPAGWIPGFNLQINQSSSTGLTALTFVDSDPTSPYYHDVVIAFRGSVTAYDWGVADLNLALGISPSVFAQAVNYVTQKVETTDPLS
jgi:hypothetical protein